MKVEVWYDFTCPYCYLAIEKLHQALSRFPNRTSVDIVYRSFQLTMPFQTNIEERNCNYNRPHFDPDENMYDKLKTEASQLGISMKFFKTEWIDTLHAHRLVKLANCYGKETKVVRALFESLYERKQRIDDCNTLLTIGVEAGLDETEVDVLLCLNRYKKSVATDKAIAKEMGITSIPFFIFNDQFAISGAKPVELFHEVLVDAWTELERQGKVLQKKRSNNSTYCEGNECKMVKEDENDESN